MKLVKKENYALLQKKADAFNAIVATVVESSEGATPEDVTAETIIDALQENANDTALADAQASVTATQDLLTASEFALQTAKDRIQELEDELNNDPSDPPAIITPTGDGGDNAQTIAQFADKNKGNTQAILAMAVKDGLI